MWSIVNRDLAADDVWIGAVTSGPELVAHDGHSANRRILAREQATQCRRSAKHREQTGCDARRRYDLWITAAGDVCRAKRVGLDGSEQARFAPESVNSGRRRPRHRHVPAFFTDGADFGEPPGIRIRQAIDQHRIHDRKHRRRGADPEREREDDERRESGRPPQVIDYGM
jgi:hypothetical protein